MCVCRDSLLASLLDGVRASGNRDVCVKMAPTQRGQRWGLLSMPVDEEVESLHLKFLAAPPSEFQPETKGVVVVLDTWMLPCLILPSLLPLLRWKLCRRGVQIQREHLLQRRAARCNPRRECVQSKLFMSIDQSTIPTNFPPLSLSVLLRASSLRTKRSSSTMPSWLFCPRSSSCRP